MKRVICIFILAGTIALSLAACKTRTIDNRTIVLDVTSSNVHTTTTLSTNMRNYSTVFSQTTWITQNRPIESLILPNYDPNEIKLDPPPASEIPRYEVNYRSLYYSGDFSYVLLGNEKYEKWLADYWAKLDHKVEPQEMALVDAIRRFKIPKEKFVEWCLWLLKDRLDNGYDIYSEGAEIPNPEIIYTFDNEIINDYYRRDR